MVLALVGVIAGLGLLTYASDQFVVGAARLAIVWRLSPVVIGAVVIGFGTSAPEMLVSGLAAGQGSLDLGVGNIIGSNVANLSLVLGVAALITPIVVASPVLRREAPISMGAVLVFAVLVQGGLSRWDATLLAIILVVGLGLILWTARPGDPAITSEVAEFLHEAAPSARRESLRTVAGLMLTLAGAQLLVVSAMTIASELGIAEGFVGLTLVAVGTSLPELATAVQAARRRQTDLIVGNLLGSNLFNAGAVGAVAGFTGPGPLADATLAGAATYLMVAVALVATVLMSTSRRVDRWEGGVLIAVYAVVIPMLA